MSGVPLLTLAHPVGVISRRKRSNSSPRMRGASCGEDEGLIKFHFQRISRAVEPFSEITEINRWRSRLIQKQLLGRSAQGIGFGNLSVRIDDSQQFFITGSQTEHWKRLQRKHFSRIINYNFKQPTIVCSGPCAPSSESLSHAALYQADVLIGAVIHIHCQPLWRAWVNIFPTTSSQALFGTGELAREIIKLYSVSDLPMRKVLVMGGHPDGLIFFGKTLSETGAYLLQAAKKIPFHAA